VPVSDPCAAQKKTWVPGVLLLSRDLVVERLNEFVVVPATRTIRGIPTEVVLAEEDGMPVVCALNFDHISLTRKDRVGAALTSLNEGRWVEVERALLSTCGFGPDE
jgi:mRNA interferase MazF